jgi:hypothetical protein
MFSATELQLRAVEGLAMIQPGFYVDDTGREYFYLTGLYALVTDRILENPFLNTPSFVTAVLEGLREELEKMNCMELMD